MAAIPLFEEFFQHEIVFAEKIITDLTYLLHILNAFVTKRIVFWGLHAL